MANPPSLPNKGHQVKPMALPTFPRDVDFSTILPRQLADLGSLVVLIDNECRQVLADEHNNERYGRPVRYEDGLAEEELHLPRDAPVVVEPGDTALGHQPRDWPKTLKDL